jgi:hypothetical protein
VPGWWEDEADWRLIAPYCDVIGYDRYASEFADDRLQRLILEMDKPIFCGEFSFPPFYKGQRALDGIRFGQRTRRKRARPIAVGCKRRLAIPTASAWLGFRTAISRSPGEGRDGVSRLVYGEHFAFGTMDITDRSKWPLVERMREANRQAVQWRLTAMER